MCVVCVVCMCLVSPYVISTVQMLIVSRQYRKDQTSPDKSLVYVIRGLGKCSELRRGRGGGGLDWIMVVAPKTLEVGPGGKQAGR